MGQAVDGRTKAWTEVKETGMNAAVRGQRDISLDLKNNLEHRQYRTKCPNKQQQDDRRSD